MPEQPWPWTARRFQFDFPPAKLPELVERLRGTPARIERLIENADETTLSQTDGQGWSIKQNIGHLLDLGYLPDTRIDEIIAGKEILTAADMTNRATNNADHNDRPIRDLLDAFRNERAALIRKFENVPEPDWGKSALHPRLKTPMRIVDIACFDAEHDDYHVARIRALLRHFDVPAGC